MANILALDWDEHEIRYLLASASRSRIVLKAVGSQPLVDVSEAGEKPRPDWEGSLRSLLSDRQFAGARVVVGLESARVELLPLELPPAEDHELPELVLFQAVRQVQQPAENLVVDFLPLEGDAQSKRKVLAAVFSRDELGRLCALLRRMKLKPARVVFRPLAVAALVRYLVGHPPSPCLVINRVGLQADLSLLVEGRATFFRSVRLPEAPPATQLSRLVLEAERTVTVALASQLAGEKLSHVYVLGTGEEHGDLAERLSEQLGTEAEILDPLQVVDVSHVDLPENTGRFSAHVGMIVQEAAGIRPEIDFLHVRRPPPRLKRSHLIAGAAGIVALVTLVSLWSFWSRYSAIASEQATLQAELRELEQAANKASRQQRLVGAVADWVGGEIVWLDELADLSLKLPAARHIVVSRLTGTAAGRGTGNIFLQGFVRDPRILQQMEYGIRDRFRRVETPRIFEREAAGESTWSFESSVVVSRRQPAEYLIASLGKEAEGPKAQEADVSSAQGALAAQEASPKPSATPKQASLP